VAFAAERVDTWVLKVSIALPLVLLAGLVVWHLVGYLVGQRPRKRRVVRESPEPPSAPTRDDPEQLQQACTALEEALAQKYLELAEGWLRRGQTQQAAAALSKVIQLRPQSHPAQVAHNRLQAMGLKAADQPP
jgi:hypothetical protein